MGDKLENVARLLLDEARIIEGEQLIEPVKFAHLLNAVITDGIS